MKSKAAIKIIKKSEMGIPKSREIKIHDAERNATRELVATVTNWISEFHANRSDDAKRNFAHLFGTQKKLSS